MNYRHNFHAGSIADVFKHYVLTLSLQALASKPAPFCVIDSHAGAGSYTLKMPGEYQHGLGLLWPQRHKWPALADYFAGIERLYGTNLSHYPGSPLIIRAALRLQDRAILVELNPAAYETLKVALAGSKNIAVHHNDAWHALKAFIPPQENRGLVLIDPSYEHADEFDRIITALTHAIKHWRNGSYIVWYPIKQRALIIKFYQALRALHIKAQAIEFTTLPTDVEQRLNGSGLVLINPSWKLLDTLRQTLLLLAKCLAGKEGQGQVKFIDLA